MKKLTKLSTLLAICTLLGTSALAAAPAPAANTPVADGLKEYNLRVNPLGLAFGSLSGVFDIGISDNMTVGPMFGYASSSVSATTTVGASSTTTTSKTTVFGVGAQMNLFLSQTRFLDSWVFSPFVQYASATAGSTSASALAFGGDFGYQWFWGNGFNMGLGLGAGYYSFDAKVFAISGFLPSGYFTVGYAF